MNFEQALIILAALFFGGLIVHVVNRVKATRNKENADGVDGGTRPEQGTRLK